MSNHRTETHFAIVNPSGRTDRADCTRCSTKKKQTASIDLKDERGKQLLLDMAAEADVFVEDFRPGVVDNLGIGPDTLRAENPDLIYCSLSGFGQTGPRRDQPAHALNYEGLAGLLDPDDPSCPGFPVADFSGAQMLVIAVLAAIRTRDRGGDGQYIDFGLFEVLASWNRWNDPWAESDATEFDHDPLVGGEYPCYNTYETADGHYLTLGIMEPKFWEELCERLDRPDLVDGQFDTGRSNSGTYHEIQAEFEQRPLEECYVMSSTSVRLSTRSASAAASASERNLPASASYFSRISSSISGLSGSPRQV